eukprot:GSChrysophyteH1.ASY1.ANO1.3288.1 assembled CDS
MEYLARSSSSSLWFLWGLLLLISLQISCASIYSVHKADLPIYLGKSLESEKLSDSLPIGEVVVGEKVDGGWLRMDAPYAGYIVLESGVVSEVTRSMGSHPCSALFRTSNRAFHAGEYTLGTCNPDSTSWIDQWPVGAGGIAALAGGSLMEELVPLGAPDFVTAPMKGLRQRFNAESKSMRDQFQAMRKAQLEGNLKEADKMSRKMLASGELGRFEFLGDLALVFAVPPKDRLPADATPRSRVLSGMKEELVRMKGGTDLGFASDHRVPTKGKSGSKTTVIHRHTAVSHLHMDHGAATATYISESRDVVHHRRWQVTPSGVLLGTLQSRSAVADKPTAKDCLTFALRLGRHGSGSKGEGLLIPSKVEQLGRHHMSSADAKVTAVMYQMGLALSPGMGKLAPHAYVAAAVICELPVESQAAGNAHHMRHHATTDMIICRGGQRAWIMVVVEKEDSVTALHNFRHAESDDRVHNGTVLEELKRKCLTRLNDTLKLGASGGGGAISWALNRQSFDWFSSRMYRQSLRIGSLTPPSPQRVGSVAAVADMYQFGRYLMLSGGDKHVMNLQGQWVDGVLPNWNADYHLNINLQMNYWSAETSDLSQEVIPALVKFLSKIRTSGTQTAKQMYGAQKGWVAHGFTDAYLDVGLRGNPCWAYCVTCGAWASLSLWEHITYAPVGTATSNEALTELFLSFQGTAEFFLDHFTTTRTASGEVEFHMGPSGSPENSYTMVDSGGQRSTYIVAMNPAIDISVLRNVALAYNIAATRLLNDMRIDIAAKKDYPNAYGKPSDALTGNDTAIEHDPGHRHWSGMHWLYPGSMLPEGFSADDKSDQLYIAAVATMRSKAMDGGGHTGWSAAWEASLWARLGHSAASWQALEHILDNKRTMVTNDGSMFQIDANFGFVAAVQEMLLQTHVPGIVKLLPAVPGAWAANTTVGSEPNFVRGLKGRGDTTVDIIWKYTKTEGKPFVLAASITYHSEHFYHALRAVDSFEVVTTNSGVSVVTSDARDSCVVKGERANSFSVRSYPCKVTLCGAAPDVPSSDHCLKLLSA